MLQECGTSEATTRGVTVTVRASFVPDQSQPEAGRWFFAYRIRITNTGADTVQLISRHWIITDANGNEEEVEGPGVVGEQPLLQPGESFTYSSGCPLTTKAGAMRGWYHFVDAAGGRFRAEIPAFALTQSSLLN